MTPHSNPPQPHKINHCELAILQKSYVIQWSHYFLFQNSFAFRYCFKSKFGLQLQCMSSNQFFHHSSILIHVLHLQLTMFYSCQHPKQIDHAFNFYLWTHDSNNCFAWKPTFGNWPSWMHHKASGFEDVNGGIENLLNKNNFLLTNVHEISSIEVPTPNIFSLRSNLTTSTTVIIHALTIWFN